MLGALLGARGKVGRRRGLHSLRRVGPISYREAGLARLERALERINAALKGVRAERVAAVNDGDSAGPLDYLRMHVDAIVDDREAERMLENIASAIGSAFELGRIAGEDRALKDREGR
jgi:hypothetical protein